MTHVADNDRRHLADTCGARMLEAVDTGKSKRNASVMEAAHLAMRPFANKSGRSLFRAIRGFDVFVVRDQIRNKFGAFEFRSGIPTRDPAGPHAGVLALQNLLVELRQYTLVDASRHLETNLSQQRCRCRFRRFSASTCPHLPRRRYDPTPASGRHGPPAVVRRPSTCSGRPSTTRALARWVRRDADALATVMPARWRGGRRMSPYEGL